MRGFSLPAPVDAIITMYDSIDCLSAGDDLVDHFRTVSANLNKGGIYLFEVTHPRDCSMWSYGRHKYEGERDGTKVEIIWAVNDPVPDMLTQIAEVETILRVTENGNVSEFRDRARERFTLPQEFHGPDQACRRTRRGGRLRGFRSGIAHGQFAGFAAHDLRSAQIRLTP